MAIWLSLCAAIAYGLSDFVGGVTSRRVSPWAVAFTAQLGGSAITLAVALVVGGDPVAADLWWSVAAGAANGLGTSFLYRGLSSGRMGVVAPVSGVGAALVPVVVGVATGERPGAAAWAGIVIALPAIYLVSRSATPDVDRPRESNRAALIDGALAGLGFGLLFAALAQVRDDAGLLPLALNQLVGGIVVAALATGLVTGMGAVWLPRNLRALLGVLCGALGATATGLFLIATHHGLLTVSAVLTSLYPATTVVLAAVVLREHIHRHQGIGMLLCAAAVTLCVLG